MTLSQRPTMNCEVYNPTFVPPNPEIDTIEEAIRYLEIALHPGFKVDRYIVPTGAMIKQSLDYMLQDMNWVLKYPVSKLYDNGQGPIRLVPTNEYLHKLRGCAKHFLRLWDQGLWDHFSARWYNDVRTVLIEAAKTRA